MCRPNNKISKAAAQAFIERRPFRRGNTEVVTSPSCSVLKLYGTIIGENSESRGIAGRSGTSAPTWPQPSVSWAASLARRNSGTSWRAR